MTARPQPRRLPRTTGERAFLQDLRRQFRTPASPALALGIGDDCALLRPTAGLSLAVTTDLFIEGRHFRRDTHSARSAGHRCLARGLSDLAAMGAVPLACFLSLAIPPGTLQTTAKRRWLDHFLAGLHALALTHHVPLAGGDTGEAPGDALIADIVLLGQVDPAHALTRANARPGDDLWISGALGGAAAQLEKLLARTPARSDPDLRGNQNHNQSKNLRPQTFPQPRLALGQALARRTLPNSNTPGVTACLDLSDGLSTDLLHLCTESNVAAQLDASRLPLHPLTRPLAPAHALHLALNGGEDYELLFTTRPATRLPRTLAGVPLTRIGSILPHRRNRPRITLLNHDGTPTPLPPGGWQHLTNR